MTHRSGILPPIGRSSALSPVMTPTESGFALAVPLYSWSMTAPLNAGRIAWSKPPGPWRTLRWAQIAMRRGEILRWGDGYVGKRCGGRGGNALATDGLELLSSERRICAGAAIGNCRAMAYR